jgi:hypothetical protein
MPPKKMTICSLCSVNVTEEVRSSERLSTAQGKKSQEAQLQCHFQRCSNIDQTALKQTLALFKKAPNDSKSYPHLKPAAYVQLQNQIIVEKNSAAKFAAGLQTVQLLVPQVAVQVAALQNDHTHLAGQIGDLNQAVAGTQDDVKRMETLMGAIVEKSDNDLKRVRQEIQDELKRLQHNITMTPRLELTDSPKRLRGVAAPGWGVAAATAVSTAPADSVAATAVSIDPPAIDPPIGPPVIDPPVITAVSTVLYHPPQDYISQLPQNMSMWEQVYAAQDFIRFKGTWHHFSLEDDDTTTQVASRAATGGKTSGPKSTKLFKLIASSGVFSSDVDSAILRCPACQKNAMVLGALRNGAGSYNLAHVKGGTADEDDADATLLCTPCNSTMKTYENADFGSTEFHQLFFSLASDRRLCASTAARDPADESSAKPTLVSRGGSPGPACPAAVAAHAFIFARDAPSDKQVQCCKEGCFKMLEWDKMQTASGSRGGGVSGWRLARRNDVPTHSAFFEHLAPVCRACVGKKNKAT